MSSIMVNAPGPLIAKPETDTLWKLKKCIFLVPLSVLSVLVVNFSFLCSSSCISLRSLPLSG